VEPMLGVSGRIHSTRHQTYGCKLPALLLATLKLGLCNLLPFLQRSVRALLQHPFGLLDKCQLRLHAPGKKCYPIIKVVGLLSGKASPLWARICSVGRSFVHLIPTLLPYRQFRLPFGPLDVNSLVCPFRTGEPA
jgi:hypothetical protein